MGDASGSVGVGIGITADPSFTAGICCVIDGSDAAFISLSLPEGFPLLPYFYEAGGRASMPEGYRLGF